MNTPITTAQLDRLLAAAGAVHLAAIGAERHLAVGDGLDDHELAGITFAAACLVEIAVDLRARTLPTATTERTDQ